MKYKLYSAQDVADLLGVKLDTIQRYVRTRHGRGMRIGQSGQFSEADVEFFIQQLRLAAHVKQKPKVLLLPDALSQAANHSEEAAGITFRGSTFSYSEIQTWAMRLAENLLRQGVLPGERVVVLLPNSIEFIVSCFAVWKAGAILVAEDPAIRKEALAHILQDAAPSALIVARPVAERLRSVAPYLRGVNVILVNDRADSLSGLGELRVEPLDAVLVSESADDGGNRFPCTNPADIACISYGSGTTSKPKGTLHTHESWLADAACIKNRHKLTGSTAGIIPQALHHPQAFRHLLACLLAGARIHLPSESFGLKTPFGPAMPAIFRSMWRSSRPCLARFAKLQKLVPLPSPRKRTKRLLNCAPLQGSNNPGSRPPNRAAA